jgi:hypothetical protein
VIAYFMLINEDNRNVATSCSKLEPTFFSTVLKVLGVYSSIRSVTLEFVDN